MSTLLNEAVMWGEGSQYSHIYKIYVTIYWDLFLKLSVLGFFMTHFILMNL